MKKQHDGSVILVTGLAAQLVGPASVISAVFPSTCHWPSSPRHAVFTLTQTAAAKASEHHCLPFSILARSLKDVSAITSYPLVPPVTTTTPCRRHLAPPALRRPLTPSTGAPRRVKHGALYSRKGACPHRTSGPFNGRPQAGIRPPLLGLRRVLQHRHANISSGRPKWKTQTRNIEISSARTRERERKRVREADSGGKKRGKAQSGVHARAHAHKGLKNMVC